MHNIQWRSTGGNEFNFMDKTSKIFMFMPGLICHVCVNNCRLRIEGNANCF